jgi:hypothetical protein
MELFFKVSKQTQIFGKILSLTHNLRSLSIVCSDSLVEFPEIPNGLLSLTISYCDQFIAFPTVPPSLGYLDIEYCESLQYLRVLPKR